VKKKKSESLSKDRFLHNRQRLESTYRNVPDENAFLPRTHLLDASDHVQRHFGFLDLEYSFKTLARDSSEELA